MIYGTWQKKVTTVCTHVNINRYVHSSRYIFRCCVHFFRQAERNLDVTLFQMPIVGVSKVEENSLLHVIGVHHLQLLSRSRKKWKYDNAKEDRSSKPTTLGRVNSSNLHSERGDI